jgi:hypothetical protein
MKRCKNKDCRAEFTPARPLQSACSIACAISLTNASKERARSEKARKERIEHRQAKERIKPRSKWLKEAEAVVNRYVRLRDAHLGCVSCDRPASWSGQWHASHLRSVGASSATRFHLWNIHKSCSICNTHLSANLSEYLPRLRARIGDAKVDWLYQQNQPVTYSIEYVARLKKIFAKRCRMLEKRLALRS